MRLLDDVRERLWGNSSSFTLLPVGPNFEKLIADGITDTGTWHVLAMELEACQNALTAVRRVLAEVGRPANFVGDPAVRIHVRKLIEQEFPRVPVLAERELLKEGRVDVGRTIELD